VDKWNLSKPDGLRGFPRGLRPFLQTQAQVDGFKIDAREQIESRLRDLRVREEKLNGEISGMDIERELRNIARLIVSKGNNLYYGSATVVDHSFNARQKKVLYGLLTRIRDKLPWAGIHYGKHAANAAVKEFIEMVSREQRDEDKKRTL